MKMVKCKDCRFGKILEAPCKWDQEGNEIDFGPSGYIECTWKEVILPTPFYGDGLHVMEEDQFHECQYFQQPIGSDEEETE
jgi:hypothetical protein